MPVHCFKKFPSASKISIRWFSFCGNAFAAQHQQWPLILATVFAFAGGGDCVWHHDRSGDSS